MNSPYFVELAKDIKQDIVPKKRYKESIYTAIYFDSFQSTKINSFMPKNSRTEKWLQTDDNHDKFLKNFPNTYFERKVDGTDYVVVACKRSFVQPFLNCALIKTNRLQVYMYENSFHNTLLHWRNFCCGILSDWWARMTQNYMEC